MSKTTIYVLAELLAMSIRRTNPDSKICLITNEDAEWIKVDSFDDIVHTWEDKADEHKWKVQNRWKIYLLEPMKKLLC